MDNWFHARGGQQQGPFSIKNLREMAARKELTAGDLVWREGMAQWLPAGQVSELAGCFVEPTEATAPTVSVFQSAACIARSDAISLYQRVVKPASGKAMNTELLNEKIGNSTTGP